MKNLKPYLERIIDDIDAGNSNLDEDEAVAVAKFIKEVARSDTPMSKYQAYTYLGISRATFDNLVREGRLPEGRKLPGFKEKIWYKKDLKRK